MATGLLESQSLNYLDLIGNGRSYEVPPFQRDYSWDEEQWEDLWQDILELRDKPEARHYLGAVVVQAKSDRESVLIDGQQRLATLTILALAIISKLNAMADAKIDPEANRDRAAALRSRFVGDKDPASLVEQSKLKLNETDNGLFADYLVQNRNHPNPARLPHSNQLLLRAFTYFRKQLDKEPGLQKDGVALARLLSESAARGLIFIRISVQDEVSAYTVFETLNARGLELSTTDLLKNYLFSRLTGHDLEHLQRRWRDLVARTTQRGFVDCLRYHMLCSKPVVRKERLFKEVRDTYRDASNVLELIDELEPRAEVFAAVQDPSDPYWLGKPEQQASVEALSLFGVRQFMPVLFAACERFDAEIIGQVLRTIVTISFRFSVVSKLNTNSLEPIYSKAAQAILAGRATNASQVFSFLQEAYVSDEKFQTDFEGLRFEPKGKSAKQARYVLRCIESRSLLYRQTDLDLSLEHVLPLNPDNAWLDVAPVERWTALSESVGNLLLLEPSLNREAGVQPYAVKRGIYQRSAVASARLMAESSGDEWGPAQIAARSRALARQAVQVWRCDF